MRCHLSGEEEDVGQHFSKERRWDRKYEGTIFSSPISRTIRRSRSWRTQDLHTDVMYALRTAPFLQRSPHRWTLEHFLISDPVCISVCYRKSSSRCSECQSHWVAFPHIICEKKRTNIMSSGVISIHRRLQRTWPTRLIKICKRHVFFTLVLKSKVIKYHAT